MENSNGGVGGSQRDAGANFMHVLAFCSQNVMARLLHLLRTVHVNKCSLDFGNIPSGEMEVQ